MALTAARQLFQSKGEPKTRSVLMAASTTIYRGGFVMIDANGVAVPAAAGANNHGCVGVALETVTSPASGATYVKVQYGGPFKIPSTYLSNFGQSDVGEFAYATDDEDVNDDANAATNTPPLGYIVELDGTDAWIEIDPAVNASLGPHT